MTQLISDLMSRNGRFIDGFGIWDWTVLRKRTSCAVIIPNGLIGLNFIIICSLTWVYCVTTTTYNNLSTASRKLNFYFDGTALSDVLAFVVQSVPI